MDLAPMQALALRCQFAFLGGTPLSRLLIALAGLPAQSCFAPLLDAALCIVVARIGRAPLPIHLALQPTDGLFIGGEFLTENRKAGFFFSWNQSDGGCSQVPPHVIPPPTVLLLL